MKTIAVATLLVALLNACATPSSPDTTIEIVTAERATYTVLPGGTFARLALTFEIQNNGDESADPLLCGLSVEREIDGRGQFTAVHTGACNETSNASERIAPRSGRTISLVISLETRHLDAAARYRVTLPVSFGPDFRQSLRYVSTPFVLLP